MNRKVKIIRDLFFIIGVLVLLWMVYNYGIDKIWQNIRDTGWWFFAIIGIWTIDLEDARRTVTDADALIAATPVFQGSYSGLFKMFFDALDMKSLAGIPVTMVATAGTARHSMVLDFAVRPLLSFLHAVVLPTGVFVDTAEFGADSALPRRVATAAGELAEQLTSVVSGVAGFTGSTETREPAEGDATAGEGVDGAAPEDADVHVPAGGFAALLAGHSGE